MIQQTTFIDWFEAVFVNDPLFVAMANCTEGSPHHREASVGLHTQMVVDIYLKQTRDTWTRNDILGALACAFHDVGKPVACVKKYSESRGHYNAFTGHELVSARLWETWAVQNFTFLRDVFDLMPTDVYTITWMIEYHRPWYLKKAHKVQKLKRTALLTCGIDPFVNMLIADSHGRDSDDWDDNTARARKWVDDFNKFELPVQQWWADSPLPSRIHKYQPGIVTVLIGASGSGKSTYVDRLPDDVAVYSWDLIRHQLYDQSDYDNAFRLSTEDKQFMSKARAIFIDMINNNRHVVVDNTNVSSKARAWFIDQAMQLNYRTVAVVFPIAIDTLIDRQSTRTDKSVPENAVRAQYERIQQPQAGEFDEIVVADSNMSLVSNISLVSNKYINENKTTIHSRSENTESTPGVSRNDDQHSTS